MKLSLNIIEKQPSCSRGLSESITGLESLFPHTDEDILDNVYDRVSQGTQVFVGFSGGKDSVSTCLLLKELGIPFTAVFADTNWEAQITSRYVEWFCATHDIPLVVVNNEGEETMLDVCRRKGCFPKRQRRFCTEELKDNPIKKYLSQVDGDVISVAGIRAAESEERAEMSTWVESDKRFKCDVWHPIFTWTYEDVIAMHHRHNCRPNPLYLLGCDRVGCFPCIFEKKAGLRVVSLVEPERIADIRQAEEDIDQHVRKVKGDAYEERNYPTSTMFWMSVHGQSRPVLIDDMIQRAWEGNTKAEKALLGDGTLRGQINAAQDRWGFSIDLGDMDLSYSESELAIHADYSERYKTRKELV